MHYIAVFDGSQRVDEDAWEPCTLTELIEAGSDEEAADRAKAMLGKIIEKEHLQHLYAISREVNLGKWHLRVGFLSDSQGKTLPEEYDTKEQAQEAGRRYWEENDGAHDRLHLLRPDGTIEWFGYKKPVAA
jgi:hypothetical protein